MRFHVRQKNSFAPLSLASFSYQKCLKGCLPATLRLCSLHLQSGKEIELTSVPIQSLWVAVCRNQQPDLRFKSVPPTHAATTQVLLSAAACSPHGRRNAAQPERRLQVLPHRTPAVQRVSETRNGARAGADPASQGVQCITGRCFRNAGEGREQNR